MWLFPYEKFTIVSDLKPDEIVRRLQSAIYIPNGNLYKKEYSVYSTKYFVGYVYEDGFEVKPDINYRNSFLPEINGIIKICNSGSRINIKMKITTAIIVFLCLWQAFALFAVIALTVKNISSGKFDPMTFAPCCLMLFGYLLALFGFKYESRSSKNILLNLFEGQIED